MTTTPRVRYTTESNPEAGVADDGLPANDVGNAKRLVNAYGSDLRYCHAWSAWLIWDGRHWRTDATGAIERMAKDLFPEKREIARILLDAARHYDKDSPERKKLALLARLNLSLADRGESGAGLREMIKIATSEPGISVSPDQLDADPYLLNCPNGTLDLRTGELRPHRQEYLITKMTAVPYDPEARSDRWEQFLHTVTGGDAQLREFLQRAAGYSLTGDTSEEKLFFIY